MLCCFVKTLPRFIHEFPNASMANVDGASDCVRVEVLTNVDALDPSELIAWPAVRWPLQQRVFEQGLGSPDRVLTRLAGLQA